MSRRDAFSVLAGAPIVGVLAGLSSWVFIEGLDWATRTRVGNEWILWLLPIAGLGLGLANRYVAGRAVEGTALVVREASAPSRGVPKRMWWIALGGTVASHLFGGSVGREGTAVQMAGGLTESALGSRVSGRVKRWLLVAAIAGGFGAVFGVPIAGTIFALEVIKGWAARAASVVPAAIAAFVGDRIVYLLGADHGHIPEIPVDHTLGLYVRVTALGLGCGATAWAFSQALRRSKAVVTDRVSWAPARPMLGGALILALVGVFGTAYLGLSLPLADSAVAGEPTSAETFALKLLFTVVSLAFGFIGGEVTPLFVTGATLGSALATPLGADRSLFAAVGLTTVFAAAARAPVAMAVLSGEVFGWRFLPPAGLAAAVAAFVSSRKSIYAPDNREEY